SQDRKSTTGGSQFLGRRLISWQCKKQIIVATSTTEAEYVAAASCCGQGEFNSDFHPMVDFIAASPLRIETTNEGTHILATMDGISRTVSESSLRRNLKLRDKDCIVSIPDTELFENLTLMGIVPFFDTMLKHQGEGSGTPTEPHHTPSPEADTSHHTTSSIPLSSIPTAPIPPITQPDTTPI
nr:putative ribonuclease H-like domain-containing protein [Tanacetum cinerariifolium]